MAAAGPHLSVMSWGPLFQAAGALGPSALLPPSPSPLSIDFGGGFGSGARGGEMAGVGADRYEFENDEEEAESWTALNALWEVIFLQVRKERLDALCRK